MSTTGVPDGPPFVTGAQIGDSGTGLHLGDRPARRAAPGAAHRPGPVRRGGDDGRRDEPVPREVPRPPAPARAESLSEYSVPTYQGMGDVPRAGNDSGGGQLGNAIHCKPHGAERLALRRRAGSGVGARSPSASGRTWACRTSPTDPRLATIARAAQEPAAHVDAASTSSPRSYTKREFMAILNPLDVPCGPIMSTEDLANDEHVRGRDMWVELDHPQRGKWFNVGMPIKLSASPAMIERSPTLGEHTEEVLKEVLGYDDAKVARAQGARAHSPRRRRRAALSRLAADGSSQRRHHENRDHRPAGLRQGGARGVPRARRRRSRACSARRRRRARKPDPLQGRRAGEGPQGLPVPVAASAPRRTPAMQGAERRHRHHGLRAAVRAAGFRARSRSTAPSSTTRRCCPSTAGPSSINWPIIKGETKTGLTIFRPTDGLDEGPVILQKETPVSRERHAGHRLLRPPVPAWACRRCSRPPTWWSPASTGKSCRTNRRRPTRAGAARTRRRSTGPTTSTSSTTLIRGCDPAPGRVDHDRRQEAAALRLEEAPRAHLRRGEGQDRRDRRGRRASRCASPRRAGRSRSRR